MPESRPNIIFIITDQQRFDTIRALGFPHVDTPNLDRLTREGVALTNCFITAPSCAPSRASLFTGYYPHTTGILKNEDSWTRSWVEQLRDTGYRCVNVGKMHTAPYETPLGFHERYVVENKDRYLGGLGVRYYFDEWDKALAARGLVKQQREFYREKPDYNERLGAFEWEMPEDTQSDMFVGDMAKWWIDSFPQTEPLFLQIGFPGPHPPYDPVPRCAEPYLERDLPLKDVTRADLDGQPPPFKEMREHNCEVDHDSVIHEIDAPHDRRHRQRAYYLANVTMIDEKIGEILTSLDDKGYLDNAVVIFTSDHGDCLGDHGHSQKWTMYDTITRVPAIVWAPGRLEAGRQVDDQVQLMDLGATVLDLAGITPSETMEAETLLPLLRGDDGAGGREFVFAEHPRDGILPTEYMTMVRSREWKLVHFLGESFGQLFDLANDPDEDTDLWDDPGCADRKQELTGALRDWLIRSNCRTATLMAGHR